MANLACVFIYSFVSVKFTTWPFSLVILKGKQPIKKQKINRRLSIL